MARAQSTMRNPINNNPYYILLKWIQVRLGGIEVLFCYAGSRFGGKVLRTIVCPERELDLNGLYENVGIEDILHMEIFELF